MRLFGLFFSVTFAVRQLTVNLETTMNEVLESFPESNAVCCGTWATFQETERRRHLQAARKIDFWINLQGEKRTRNSINEIIEANWLYGVQYLVSFYSFKVTKDIKEEKKKPFRWVHWGLSKTPWQHKCVQFFAPMLTTASTTSINKQK